jgi:hypothetical protein
MRKYLIGKSMRLFLFVVGSVIWAGIWLTGFAVVHWLLYVPAVFLYFAAITGICPGMIFSRFVMGEKPHS